jgi:hypothetical protein
MKWKMFGNFRQFERFRTPKHFDAKGSDMKRWLRSLLGGGSGTMPPVEGISVAGAGHVLPIEGEGMEADAIAFMGLAAVRHWRLRPRSAGRNRTRLVRIPIPGSSQTRQLTGLPPGRCGKLTP